MSLRFLRLLGLRLNLGYEFPLSCFHHHGVDLLLKRRQEFLDLQESGRDVALLRLAANSADVSRLIVLMPITAMNGTRMFQMIEENILHAGFHFPDEEFPRFPMRYATFEAGTCESDERFPLPMKKFQRFLRVLILVNVPYVCHDVVTAPFGRSVFTCGFVL